MMWFYNNPSKLEKLIFRPIACTSRTTNFLPSSDLVVFSGPTMNPVPLRCIHTSECVFHQLADFPIIPKIRLCVVMILHLKHISFSYLLPFTLKYFENYCSLLLSLRDMFLNPQCMTETVNSVFYSVSC